MVNPGESLINVVTENKPKVLFGSQKEPKGLDQKVRGQVQVLLTHLAQMMYPRRGGGT